MSRSKWKGPFLNSQLTEKNNQNKKIMQRNSLIVPSYVGNVFNIHNGKSYFELTVNENMIGHKFGEFSFTRAKFIYKKKKGKK